MDKLFEQIITRAHDMRMTENELREAAGITVARYWRAKNDKVSSDSRIKVIRELEGALDVVERAA